MILSLSDVGQSSRPRAPVVLPSASRASRGGTYDDENVPKHPPYMAFISNLPYEVDDSTIEDLFVNLKVCMSLKKIFLHLYSHAKCVRS